MDYFIKKNYDEYLEPSFLKDVIFLGIHRIDDIFSIYAAIMPYFNEIINLLTITLFKPVFGFKLFYQYATNYHQLLINSIITLFSITGIIANATQSASLYSKMKGFIIGTGFTIFSLLIPNLFMHDFLKLFKENNLLKFLMGFILIYLLDLIIHYIVFLYRIYIIQPSYRESNYYNKINIDYLNNNNDINDINNKLYIYKRLAY